MPEISAIENFCTVNEIENVGPSITASSVQFSNQKMESQLNVKPFISFAALVSSTCC